MLNKLEIRPAVGSTLLLNTIDGSNNPIYPVNDFEITTNLDQHDFKKMSQAGQWPQYSYPDAMTIHCEGNVVGLGGDDATRSADYVTKRLALLDAVLPPVTLLTARYHAVLRVRMDGMTEDADAQCVVQQQSIPMGVAYPANSVFAITWKGFLPYFIGVGTATKYQLG